MLLGYIWCYLLSQPGPNFDSPISIQYQKSVWIICFAIMLDSFTEAPYIIGQYFLFPKLRIIGDTTLIAIRSIFLCIAVVYIPSHAILSYALGTFVSVIVISFIYYGYFYWYIHLNKTYEGSDNGKSKLPFKSIQEFFPNFKQFQIPTELTKLTWTFFKQGILKQILTQGERYMMTFFDLLTFKEQGMYDLVSNLGSLAARFVFLPI